MSKFTFTDPATGREYTVNAPAGVTEEQAQAIFKQQLDTGSLIGLDVGGAINSATQLAGGLTSSQAMVNQTLGSLSSQLPIGASLNTITNSLGPGALAATSQITSSLLGQGAGLASTTVGSTSNAAAAAVRAAAGVASTASSLVLKAGTALTGAAAAAGSLASNAIKTLSNSFGGSITDGINTADLVKLGSVPGLPDLSAVNTQAAMSQAAKLVGQPHTVASDSLGVGKFGFNLPQLETAGLIKPGLAATAAAAGSSLTSVLSSPLAFTGKNGVKSLDGLLANETLQNNIQKDLMGTGLSALKTQGIPVGSLNPQAVAGLANNAAKSVSNTIDSLKNTASPEVKAEFDAVTRDSAYAVDYTETKADDSALGVVTAEPAEDTVNTEAIDAAVVRIVGNSKVFIV